MALSSDFPASVLSTIRKPGNQNCIDCHAADPDWCSFGFCTLICIDCAGKHRNLGTHVTLVQSLKLDALTEEQINFLHHAGNEQFQTYLTGLNIIVADYKDPNVLYYREIILSRYEKREPIGIDDFRAQVESHQAKAAAQASNKMPIESPDWVPDNSAAECMVCSRKFTMFARRHHCRRCGKCVCFFLC